jgi:hypothetical protein
MQGRRRRREPRAGRSPSAATRWARRAAELRADERQTAEEATGRLNAGRGGGRTANSYRLADRPRAPGGRGTGVVGHDNRAHRRHPQPFDGRPRNANSRRGPKRGWQVTAGGPISYRASPGCRR